MLLLGRREEEVAMKIVIAVSRQEGLWGKVGTMVSREVTGEKTERKN